jgi:hypothetical protein
MTRKSPPPADWTPGLILIGCTLAFPGPGFLIGTIGMIIYFILKALASLPDADTEGGKDFKTGKQPSHKGPFLPKPRPNVTRNDS